MNSYSLHPMTDGSVMDDESGIAMYSGYSGRSAFLKTHHKETSTQIISSMLLGTFTDIDIQRWLNIDALERGKLENWLVENKFIIKHSS